MFCILQTFKDNEHYNDVLSEIGDAYVEAIGWLFTDEAYENDRNDYSLKGVMTLPEFMSCVKYFISAAKSRQPLLTINDYISRLRSGKTPGDWPSPYDRNRVTLQRNTEGKEALCFSNIEHNYVEAMLWCAYIFYYIQCMLYKDNKEYQKAKAALMKAFEENSYIDKKYITKHFLIKKTKSTIDRFVKIINEQYKDNEEDSDNRNESTADNDKEKRIQQIIDEQKQEIENLKKQIENTSNRDPRPIAREFMAICHKYGLHAQTQYETEIILSILSGYSPTTFHGFWNDFVNEKPVSKDTMDRIEKKIEEKKKKYPLK